MTFQSFQEFFQELCQKEQYPPDRVIQPWLDKKPKFQVSMTSPSVVFPLQDVGTRSEIRKVSIVNTGWKSVRVKKIVTSGEFVSSTSNTSRLLERGEEMTISVFFFPTTPGIKTGRVYIEFQETDLVRVDLPLIGEAT